MHCHYCQKNTTEVDFRDVKTLEGFTSAAGKIRARRKNRFCAKHQRALAGAIKRARFLALMPYIKG